MVNSYVKLAKKLNYYPSRSEFINVSGYPIHQIKYHFGNFSKLKREAGSQLKDISKEHPEDDTLVNRVNTPPKVLLLDIETAPIVAHVWGLWDNNVGLNQIVKDWYVLGWAAKWLNEDTMHYEDLRKSKSKDTDKQLLKKMWQLLDEADIVLTQNGKSFDIRKLNARFAIHGYKPYSSIRHLDTKIISKKHFGFTSHKLEYMAKALDLPIKKSSHKKFPGHDMWQECLKGNQEAWQE